MRINFELIDLKKAIDKLSERQNKIKNTLPLMKKVSIIMFQSVMRNFQEEGTDKEKWEPLSAATIERRRKGKGKGSAKILQDTGYLRRSIFPISKNDVAEVYTNVPYAPIHQFGANIVRAMKNKNSKGIIKIPARPFMVLREEAKDRIRQLFKKYLISGEDGD